MRRLPVLLLAAALAGCGRYERFQLPAPDGEPGNPAVEWAAQERPVIERGAPGEWDAVDALNPVVVRRGGVYYNFYSGFDGRTWHTGVATSPDGVVWTKRGKALSPDPGAWEGGYIAANGAALERDGEFWYWYQAGQPPRIGLARSRDGRTFRKEPAPVLDVGPRGSWDEMGAADPYVIAKHGELFLFYLGQDRARRQRLGLARSRDGVRWTKLRGNPLLEMGAAGAFDENGLGEPAVFSSHGWWWMLYTGRDRAERRRLGLARSRDGLKWERYGPPLAHDAPWSAMVVCDPEVEPLADGIWRVWFGGGDRPRPDERLNGAIGVGTLRLR